MQHRWRLKRKVHAIQYYQESASALCLISLAVFLLKKHKNLYVDLIWHQRDCRGDSSTSDLCWVSLSYSNSWEAWETRVIALSLPPALPLAILFPLFVGICSCQPLPVTGTDQLGCCIPGSEENSSAIVHLLEINYCNIKEKLLSIFIGQWSIWKFWPKDIENTVK